MYVKEGNYFKCILRQRTLYWWKKGMCLLMSCFFHISTPSLCCCCCWCYCCCYSSITTYLYCYTLCSFHSFHGHQILYSIYHACVIVKRNEQTNRARTTFAFFNWYGIYFYTIEIRCCLTNFVLNNDTNWQLAEWRLHKSRESHESGYMCHGTIYFSIRFLYTTTTAMHAPCCCCCYCVVCPIIEL